MKELTEKEIRLIAKEEAMKVQEELVKKVDELENSIKKSTKILQRLDRLLLGEEGVEAEDTLKARANFAYQYAKRNTDLQLIDKMLPVINWFERWNIPEDGCDESRLESLGKMVGLYVKIKWILGLIGVTTLINAIPVIQNIIHWVSSVGHP